MSRVGFSSECSRCQQDAVSAGLWVREAMAKLQGGSKGPRDGFVSKGMLDARRSHRQAPRWSWSPLGVPCIVEGVYHRK